MITHSPYKHKMSSKCLVSDCRQPKPVSSPHKSARKLVLLCYLGKTHPGRLALMFIQPLLAVATKDAVIWRWKSSRAQSSKRGSARSSKTLKSRAVSRAPLSAHLHRYTRCFTRAHRGLPGLWPSHQHFKIHQERVLGEIRKNTNEIKRLGTSLENKESDLGFSRASQMSKVDGAPLEILADSVIIPYLG